MRRTKAKPSKIQPSQQQTVRAIIEMANKVESRREPERERKRKTSSNKV